MKQDFDQLQEICARSSRLSETVVDDVLIYYAAERMGVASQMNKRFRRYRHIFTQLPEGTEEEFKAQYLAHLLFREDGIAARYDLKAVSEGFSKAERNFLSQQIEVPWRITFSVITDQPAPDFYQMQDIFRDRSFLLYSPGVTRTLEERSVLMWHTLIGYNGACWQSYGPIAGYSTFDDDDLFFYASEVSAKSLHTDADFVQLVETNPVPFMPLLAYSQSPIMQSHDHELRYFITELETDDFAVEELQRDFLMEQEKDTYRFTLNSSAGQHPHQALIYYKPSRQLMYLNASTEWGYAQMRKTLKRYGFNLDELADVAVHPVMVAATEEILQRKLNLWPFEHLFAEPLSPLEQAEQDNMNNFLADLVEEFKEEGTPNTEKLAERHGLDMETAQGLVQVLQDKMQQMRDKKPPQ